nr:hypothetical protein [Desulfonatronum thiodismutans]
MIDRSHDQGVDSVAKVINLLDHRNQFIKTAENFFSSRAHHFTVQPEGLAVVSKEQRLLNGTHRLVKTVMGNLHLSEQFHQLRGLKINIGHPAPEIAGRGVISAFKHAGFQDMIKNPRLSLEMIAAKQAQIFENVARVQNSKGMKLLQQAKPFSVQIPPIHNLSIKPFRESILFRRCRQGFETLPVFEDVLLETLEVFKLVLPLLHAEKRRHERALRDDYSLHRLIHLQQGLNGRQTHLPDFLDVAR